LIVVGEERERREWDEGEREKVVPAGGRPGQKRNKEKKKFDAKKEGVEMRDPRDAVEGENDMPWMMGCQSSVYLLMRVIVTWEERSMIGYIRLSERESGAGIGRHRSSECGIEEAVRNESA
jgi:hypothetical protein